MSSSNTAQNLSRLCVRFIEAHKFTRTYNFLFLFWNVNQLVTSAKGIQMHTRAKLYCIMHLYVRTRIRSLGWVGFSCGVEWLQNEKVT